MTLQKNAAFSSDGIYFACIDEKEDLLIWETATNKLINTDFTWKVNTCSCISWIPMQHKHVRILANLCSFYIFFCFTFNCASV